MRVSAARVDCGPRAPPASREFWRNRITQCGLSVQIDLVLTTNPNPNSNPDPNPNPNPNPDPITLTQAERLRELHSITASTLHDYAMM